MTEEFEISDAVRQPRRLRVMIVGSSGAGKTESSLRLAAGFGAVVNDKPVLIDTQDQSAAWYAEKYKFGLLNLKPPHDGDRFLRAIQFAATKSRIVIVDTLSDEHEGEGGMLEQHDAFLDQLVRDKARRENVSPDDIDEKKVDASAWRLAKEGRKRLIRGLRFVDAHIIFTVRAKERSKIFAPKKRQGTQSPPEQDGWVAVTDDDFLFECPIRMLVLPMSNGVPCWDPVAESERKAIRRPGQFDELMNRFKGRSLCEKVGTEMATWAKGDVGSQTDTKPDAPKMTKAETGKKGHVDMLALIAQATAHEALDTRVAESKDWHAKGFWSDATLNGTLAAIEAKRATLAEGA